MTGKYIVPPPGVQNYEPATSGLVRDRGFAAMNRSWLSSRDRGFAAMNR